MEFASKAPKRGFRSAAKFRKVPISKLRSDLEERKIQREKTPETITKTVVLNERNIASESSGVFITKRIQQLFDQTADDAKRETAKLEILKEFTSPQVENGPISGPVYSQAYINQYFTYLENMEKESAVKKALVKKGIFIALAATTTGIGYGLFVSDPKFAIEVIGRFFPDSWVERISQSPELAALKVLTFIVPMVSQGPIVSGLNQIIQGYDTRIFILSEVSNITKDSLTFSLDMLNKSLGLTGAMTTNFSWSSGNLDLIGVVVSRTTLSSFTDLATASRDFYIKYTKTGDIASELALQTLKNNLEYERELERLTEKYKTEKNFYGVLKKQQKKDGFATRILSRCVWYLKRAGQVSANLAYKYKFFVVGLLAVWGCAYFVLRYTGFDIFSQINSEKIIALFKAFASTQSQILGWFFDKIKENGLSSLDTIVSLAKTVFTPELLTQYGLTALETKAIPFFFAWLWIKKFAVPQRISSFLKKYPTFQKKFQPKFLKQALENWFGQKLEWDLAYFQICEYLFSSVSVNTVSSLVQNSLPRKQVQKVIEKLDFSTFGLFYEAAKDAAETLYKDNPDEFWGKISLEKFFPQFQEQLSRFAPGSNLYDSKKNLVGTITDISGFDISLSGLGKVNITQLGDVFDAKGQKIEFSDAVTSSLKFSAETTKEGILERARKSGYTEDMFDQDTKILRQKAEEIHSSLLDKNYREFASKKSDAETIQTRMKEKLGDIDTLISVGKFEAVLDFASKNPEEDAFLAREDLNKKITENSAILEKLVESQIKILQMEQELLSELGKSWEKYLENLDRYSSKISKEQIGVFIKPEVSFSNLEEKQTEIKKQKSFVLSDSQKTMESSVFKKQQTALSTKREIVQQQKLSLASKISTHQRQILQTQMSAFISNALSSSKFETIVDILLNLTYSTNIDSVQMTETDFSLLSDAMNSYDREKQEVSELFDKLNLDKKVLVCYNTSEYDWDLTRGYAISKASGERATEYDACFSDSVFPKVYNFIQNKAPGLVSSALATNPLFGFIVGAPISFLTGALQNVPLSYAKIAQVDDGTDDITKFILLFIEIQCTSNPNSNACKVADFQKTARGDPKTNSKYRTVDILQSLAKSKDGETTEVLKGLFGGGEKDENIGFKAYELLMSGSGKAVLNDLLFGAEGISTLRMAYSEWENKYKESAYFKNFVTEDALDRQKASESGLIFFALFDPIYLTRVSAAFSSMVGITEFAQNLLPGFEGVGGKASELVSATGEALASVYSNVEDSVKEAYEASLSKFQEIGIFGGGDEASDGASMLGSLFDSFDGSINVSSWWR